MKLRIVTKIKMERACYHPEKSDSYQKLIEVGKFF
jgi:hypothetical protein